jgi:hypothetical protein
MKPEEVTITGKLCDEADTENNSSAKTLTACCQHDHDDDGQRDAINAYKMNVVCLNQTGSAEMMLNLAGEY